LNERRISVCIVCLWIVLVTSYTSGIVPVNAYEGNGSLPEGDVDYWWISVNKDDPVLVDIQPEGGTSFWDSHIYYSNLTLVPDQYKGGTDTHIHQFIADKTDNYLLRLSDAWTGFNYTIESNHPISQHNIRVTDVSPYKTVIYEGQLLEIYVDISNIGMFTETFNVTTYANATAIGKKEITLLDGDSTTVYFIWNSTSWAKGNYTISAYVTPVPDETCTSDNTFINGWVFVTIPGDVDGDRDVDIYDVVKITGIYAFESGHPRFNPNCDLDDDGKITIYDVVRCTSHYAQSW